MEGWNLELLLNPSWTQSLIARNGGKVLVRREGSVRRLAMIQAACKKGGVDTTINKIILVESSPSATNNKTAPTKATVSQALMGNGHVPRL